MNLTLDALQNQARMHRPAVGQPALDRSSSRPNAQVALFVLVCLAFSALGTALVGEGASFSGTFCLMMGGGSIGLFTLHCRAKRLLDSLILSAEVAHLPARAPGSPTSASINRSGRTRSCALTGSGRIGNGSRGTVPVVRSENTFLPEPSDWLMAYTSGAKNEVTNSDGTWKN